jgi:hypothetical protein
MPVKEYDSTNNGEQMIEAKLKDVDGVIYSYYPCPRCINGTMTWDYDTVEKKPFLICINCGHTVYDKKENENVAKLKRRYNKKQAIVASNTPEIIKDNT